MDIPITIDDDDTLPDILLASLTPLYHPASKPGVSAWGASTSVGRVRKANEDRYGHKDTIFVVADGMGGLAGGTAASKNAVESVLERGAIIGSGASLAEWSAMITAVNTEVCANMRSLGFTKAGTTLTMVSIELRRVVVAHIGDSRLYEFSDGNLYQHTIDHNLYNELIAMNHDIEEARRMGLPLSGLVSFIGHCESGIRVDVFCQPRNTGARLLLCTDGIHNYLTDSEIATVLSSFPADEAAKQLTNRADSTGGRDNSTAIVVEL